MNKVSGCLDGQKWYRTSKQAARNAYKAGEEVLICAVNLSPFSGVYSAGNRINLDTPVDGFTTEGGVFDYLLGEYEYANCNNRTGRYAAFYLKVKEG